MSEDPGPQLHVCRAELRLARDPSLLLREVPLTPDPLVPFARVFGQVRPDLDEDARVVIDLLTATPGQRRKLRRCGTRRVQEHGDSRDWRGSVADGLDGIMRELTGGKPSSRSTPPRRTSRASSVDAIEHREDVRRLTRKLDPSATFEVQILLWTQSRVQDNAKLLMQGLLSAGRIYAGHNRFRVSGLPVARATFLGSDTWPRRKIFDYKLKTGYFRPAGRRSRNLVGADELAGMLKPPTKHCPERNVVRAGPYVAPAPRELPVYRGQRGVLPLGEVARDDKMVRVGMDLREFFFSGLFGRSRFGKTEMALVQFVHVALKEHAGGLFFDPHIDALQRVRPLSHRRRRPRTRRRAGPQPPLTAPAACRLEPAVDAGPRRGARRRSRQRAA